MNIFVNARVMLQAMNPVNADVVEERVQQGRDKNPGPAILVYARVEQALAAHLSEEEGDSEDGHDGNRKEGGIDLHADLVLQETRMMFQAPVKDEVV